MLELIHLYSLPGGYGSKPNKLGYEAQPSYGMMVILYILD